MSVICPQCKKESNSSSYRLVVDNCGHQKCRICLLEDEEACKQCSPNVKESVIKFENKNPGSDFDLAAPSQSPLQQPKLEKIEPVKDTTNMKNGPLVLATKEALQPPPSKKLPVLAPWPVNVRRTGASASATTDKSKKNCIEKRRYIIPSYIISTSSLETSQYKYKCTVCDRTFSTKSHIKYHLYCTGTGVKKPHKCNVCSKEFITKSHLNVHSLKHSDKQFKCEVCAKAFGEFSKLKRHSLVHTILKAHVCPECGKAFKSRDLLKVHSLIHRSEKPFGCKMCDAKFSNSSNLRKHLILHSSEKAHMCDQCGKRFKLKWALSVHRQSHLRIRPHKCSQCNRSFTHAKDLDRHRLSHYDVKSYSCSVCKTDFKRKDNLLRHIKNSHPDKQAEVVKNVKSSFSDLGSLIDQPNAIKVITQSPIFPKTIESPIKKNDARLGTVINGPLKLAFKTDAFKSSYNIHREPPIETYDAFNMEESVDICQKILTPQNSVSSIRRAEDPTSSKSNQPLHYETSFDNKRHGYIKNIKFKLPPDYINLKAKETLKSLLPLKSFSSSGSYAESKVAPTAPTSVIVNSNQHQQVSDLHWRRRALQNLYLDNVN